MKDEHYEEREQTEVKHRLLERYLEAAVPIIGTWVSDIAYVDCLAGPWNSTSPLLEDTSFSKAFKVLQRSHELLKLRHKSPNMRCLFIEKKQSAFSKLKAFAARNSTGPIQIRTENWDFSEHIEDVVAFIKRDSSFSFVFIDPKGWELAAVPLITPILQINPGEVLINLMTSWIRRFLSDPNKHFDRFLGAEYPRISDLSGDEQEDELVRVYAEAVRKAGGYNYVCTMPVMKPDKDAFHFHLVYATRHPKGVEEFKRAEKEGINFMHETRAEAQNRRQFEQSGGQYSLLHPNETYRELVFTRYAARSRTAARRRVEQILFRTTAPKRYDDIWVEAMQFATVQEEDLRNWIATWEREDALVVENPPMGRAKMKRGGNHLLHPMRVESASCGR